MSHRTPYIAMILAVSLMLAAVFAQLVHIPSPSHNFDLFLSALHAPGSGMIAIIIMVLFRNPSRPLKSYIIAAAAAITLGTLGELAQAYGPRDADLRDLAHNILGIAGFLSCAALFDPLLRPVILSRFRRPMLAIAGAIFLTATFPLLWYTYASAAQYSALPTLISFDSRWEQALVENDGAKELTIELRPPEWPGAGAKVARLVASATRYPGIKMRPYFDWRGYQALSFVAAAVNDTDLEISLMISYQQPGRDYPSRFFATYKVTSEPTRIQIPLADIQKAPLREQQKLGSVQEIVLFIRNAKGGEAIFLDDFRLEK